MKVLGINLGHNGSACVLEHGEILDYLEEERLSRIKRDTGAKNVVKYFLEKYPDIEYAIFAEAYTRQTSETYINSLKAKKYLTNLLNSYSVETIDYRNMHHLCHAASGFYGSGFNTAVCVILDGKGSTHTKNGIRYSEIESIYYYKDGIFKPIFKHHSTFASLKECKKQDKIYSKGINLYSDRFSIGQAFRTVSSYCGFDEPEGGKTMGLSTFGKENGEPLFTFIDGHYFASNTLLYPRNDAGWGKYYGEDVPKEDLAYNVQKCGEHLSLSIIRKAVKLTGCNNVVVSGGFFMNCVSNYNLRKNLNINLYVDPICYDGGTAIGSAKFFYHKKIKNKNSMTQLKTLYLGPIYDLSHIEGNDVTYEDVAKLISEKNIVAMFQGRSEAGPRALGNRSILYDPRDPNGKDHVNTIKKREAFRPFAGTILKEHVHQWFDMAGLEESPFMMYAVDALDHTYDKIPAILHVDNTCRVQTVTKEQNQHYYNLIDAFNNLTGVPILFNTSFNLAGEPLVETPDDALKTFYNSDIKYLYFPEVGKLIVK
jgi:carbamoyltransferase